MTDAEQYLSQALTHLHIAVNEGHAPFCRAIKGPQGETWTEDGDCDCWRKDAIEFLNKFAPPKP